MVSGTLQATVDALSFEQRAELADYLMQTLDPDDSQLTRAQEQLLAERITSMETDPTIGIPWHEVKSRFETKWA